MAPNLGDRTHLALIIGQAQHLIAADSAWTAHAPGAQKGDVPLLRVTVGQMTSLLGSLRQEGEFLASAATQTGESGFEAAVSRSGVNGDVAGKVRQIAGKYGGFVLAAQHHFRQLASIFDAERQQIEGEFKRIAGGRPSTGDMSKNAKCALGWVVLLGGGLTGEAPIAAAGVILVANNC